MITLTSTGDAYFPQAVTFATNIFAPQITVNKTVTDLNGGRVEPGDLLSYEVAVANSAAGGSDTAVDLVLRDPIPDNTTYEPNTLEIVSGANTGPKSDPVGDDEGAVSGNAVFFRLGTGASGFSGGSLAPGESTSVRFQVRVDAGTANQVENCERRGTHLHSADPGHRPHCRIQCRDGYHRTPHPRTDQNRTAGFGPGGWVRGVAPRLSQSRRNGCAQRHAYGYVARRCELCVRHRRGSHSAGTVSWALGTIGPGASGSVVVTAQVASPIADGTLLNNNAVLSADNAAAVNASASISVTSTPVLTLEKVDVSDR